MLPAGVAVRPACHLELELDKDWWNPVKGFYQSEENMRTAEDTAVLLAYLLKRSDETRVRVSEKTIRRIAQRSHLRTAFVSLVIQHLDDLGLSMMQLERGGYGLIRASILEGAPTVTAKSHLQDVLRELKKTPGHIKDIRKEVEKELASDDEDE